jgi:integrase
MRPSMESPLRLKAHGGFGRGGWWKHAHCEVGRCALPLLHEGAGRKRASAMMLRAALPPYATRYLTANPGDLRGLAAILGHSDLNTVMVYTAPKTSDLAARMERAEATGM